METVERLLSPGALGRHVHHLPIQIPWVIGSYVDEYLLEASAASAPALR
jgi:hypothetical protein